MFNAWVSLVCPPPAPHPHTLPSSTPARLHRHAPKHPLQSDQARLGRLKKVLKYLFSGQPALRCTCGALLRAQLSDTTPDALLARAQELVRRHWRQGGPEDPVLVNHMAMKGAAAGSADASAAAPYGERQWHARPGAAAAAVPATGTDGAPSAAVEQELAQAATR